MAHQITGNASDPCELTHAGTSDRYRADSGAAMTGQNFAVNHPEGPPRKARLVFARALPGVEPGPDQSRSYAEWLGQQTGPQE